MSAKNKMRYSIKNNIRRAWGLFVNTSPTWDRIAKENTSEKEIRKYQVYPWIFLCVVAIFISDLFYSPTNGLEKGILDSIITAVTLIGGYFLSNKICFWYLRKHVPDNSDSLSCEKIVSYSYTTIFALKTVTTLLPGLFFLQILSIYVAFMVWEGCRSVLKMTEDERGNIVLVFTLVIIFTPMIINKMIYLIIPNE